MKDYNIKQELNKIVSLCIDKGERTVYLQEGCCLQFRWNYEKDGNDLIFSLEYWKGPDHSNYGFFLNDKNGQKFIGFNLYEDLYYTDFEEITNFINCVNILGFYDE